MNWSRWKPILHGPVRLIAGFALILLGIAGCLLPVLPGIAFLVAGGLVLGEKHILGRWTNQGIRAFKAWWHKHRDRRNSGQ